MMHWTSIIRPPTPTEVFLIMLNHISYIISRDSFSPSSRLLLRSFLKCTAVQPRNDTNRDAESYQESSVLSQVREVGMDPGSPISLVRWELIFQLNYAGKFPLPPLHCPTRPRLMFGVLDLMMRSTSTIGVDITDDPCCTPVLPWVLSSEFNKPVYSTNHR